MSISVFHYQQICEQKMIKREFLLLFTKNGKNIYAKEYTFFFRFILTTSFVNSFETNRKAITTLRSLVYLEYHSVSAQY